MKKVLLFASAMLLSFSSYATTYLVESGSGNAGDCVWRAAGEGEVNVSLKNEGKTLQEYLNGQNLEEGDAIWIAGGKYDIAAGIVLKANGMYFGGFSGSEKDVNQRARVDLDSNGFVEPWEFENLTIVDGAAGDFTGLTLTASAKVDGLTVQNIARNENATAGILVSGAAAELVNSIARNNKITTSASSWQAPGVFITKTAAGARVKSCLIENNAFIITGNFASYGALSIEHADAIASNCVIRGNIKSSNVSLNTTNSKGTGVTVSSGKLQNSLIYNNEGASAVYLIGDAASMEYCTVVNNKMAKSFGGVHTFAVAAAVKNSIIMDNYSESSILNFSVSSAKNFVGSGIATQTAIPAWATGDNNYLITATMADLFNKPTTSAEVAGITPANWTLKSGVATNFQIGAAIEGTTTDFVGYTRPADKTCLGAYEPKTFAFNAVSGSNGTITGTNGNYYGTTAIALSATPAANYALANWTDELGTVVSTEPSFTFSMPLKTTTLTANFKASYTLTVQTGEHGTASTDKSGTYAPGAQVGLTATPNSSYQFVCWKDVVADTVVSTMPNFTYSMPAASITLKALFDVAYQLTVEVGENGTASTNKSGTYFSGTSVELTATPVDGYAFKNWTSGETVISTNANFTYTTTNVAVTLKANFYLPEPTVYLIQTGIAGDKIWRTAAQGERNVTLDSSTSLAAWIKNNGLYVGDQLWLAGGTYKLDASISTKKGIAIYGGFAGSEIAVTERMRSDLDKNGAVEPWEFTDLSIIDASTIADRATARVISVTNNNVILDGLVAQGGHWDGYNASGINVPASSTGAKLSNLIVRNNKSVSPDKNAVWGGGLALGGDAKAEGCLIEKNYSEAGTANYAAGVDASATSVIRNSVIRGNESASREGNNYGGGGLRLINTAIAENCLIYNNKATNGGGVYLGSSGSGHSPQLNYCTIVNNQVSGTSSNALGINYFGSTTAQVANCVIMNNRNGNGEIANIYDNSAILYCAYDGNALASVSKSLNVTETPEAIFVAPTKYVGLPAKDASLVSNFALKNGKQFKVGFLIEEGDTDFFGAVRAETPFVGAIENQQVALTVTAGTNGSVSSSTGDYYVGEKVELTATANATYSFINWKDQDDKIVSTEANFTFIMPEKTTTLTANFGPVVGISASQIDTKIYVANRTLYVSNEMATEVIVYNYTGQKVVASKAALSHELSLTAAGAYIVVVSSEAGRFSTPIIVY